MDFRFIFYKVRIINEDFINFLVIYGIWLEMSLDFYFFLVVISNMIILVIYVIVFDCGRFINFFYL